MAQFSGWAQTVKSNMAQLWGTIVGQCLDALQEQLKAEANYGAKVEVYDTIWLLQMLKKITAGVTCQSNHYHMAIRAHRALFGMCQGVEESVEAYGRCFQDEIQMIELLHCAPYATNRMEIYEAVQGTEASLESIQERFLAILFIKNADSSHYTCLWRELQNGVSMKKDSYPRTMADAIHLLTH